MKIRLALAAFAVVCATTGAALAQTGEAGNAAAESLFQDGRRLMEAKRYGEACPKFLASYKLSPGIGTLLNLADCYEKNGQIASAWARFHEAIALAQRLGRPEREKTARDRAEKLEPKLLRITIVAKTPDVEVKVDDVVLDAAVLGTPIPVDPGKHTIEAKAKGKKTYTTTIEVEKGRTPVVEIPPLEDEVVPSTPPETKPPETPPPPPEPRKDGTTMRVLGVVVVGLGVAGAGVGTYFGLRTSSLWSDAQGHCRNNECDPTGVELANDAKTSGNVSTIAFIAAGALLAGGAILYFTAPSGKVTAAIGPGSVGVGGRF